MEAIIIAIILVYVLRITGFIIIWNIYNLFAKKKRMPRIALVCTIGIGIIDYMLLYNLLWDTVGDYHEALSTLEYHYAIASEYSLSFVLPIVLGFLGLLVIGLVPARKVPPLISAIASAFVVIGNIVGIFFAIHIWSMAKMPFLLLLYVFHFNILLLSANHIHMNLNEQIQILNERNTTFRYPWMMKLYPVIYRISQMRVFYFLMIFPVAALLEIILILFGQGPDGIVKAFTMTADWNFSTQIPPVSYDGHYLCTVAAAGHRRVVKPLRFGTRRGTTIIVNRQLCIANAFEELIQEKKPKLHKKIRNFYDHYGYPVSKLITTPFKADVVYIVMKPLEWMFLIVLYLFDTNPEKRISKQYKWKKSL